MTKTLIKIIIKIIIITIIIQSIYIPTSDALSSLGDVLTSGENFINEGKSQGSAINSADLKSITDVTYNVLLVLGVVATVIIGAILGIRMMWGTIEQQSKAKEQLPPFVISAIVIFGAFGIWKLCIIIFSQL